MIHLTQLDLQILGLVSVFQNPINIKIFFHVILQSNSEEKKSVTFVKKEYTLLINVFGQFFGDYILLIYALISRHILMAILLTL